MSANRFASSGPGAPSADAERAAKAEHATARREEAAERRAPAAIRRARSRAHAFGKRAEGLETRRTALVEQALAALLRRLEQDALESDGGEPRDEVEILRPIGDEHGDEVDLPRQRGDRRREPVERAGVHGEPNDVRAGFRGRMRPRAKGFGLVRADRRSRRSPAAASRPPRRPSPEPRTGRCRERPGAGRRSR